MDLAHQPDVLRLAKQGFDAWIGISRYDKPFTGLTDELVLNVCLHMSIIEAIAKEKEAIRIVNLRVRRL